MNLNQFKQTTLFRVFTRAALLLLTSAKGAAYTASAQSHDSDVAAAAQGITRGGAQYLQAALPFVRIRQPRHGSAIVQRRNPVLFAVHAYNVPTSLWDHAALCTNLHWNSTRGYVCYDTYTGVVGAGGSSNGSYVDASFKHHAKLEMNMDFKRVGAYTLEAFLVLVPAGHRDRNQRHERQGIDSRNSDTPPLLPGFLPPLGITVESPTQTLKEVLDKATKNGLATVLSEDTIRLSVVEDGIRENTNSSGGSSVLASSTTVQTHFYPSSAESLTVDTHPSSSWLVAHVVASLAAADAGQSHLTDEVLHLHGMIGAHTRHFFNNLAGGLAAARQEDYDQRRRKHKRSVTDCDNNRIGESGAPVCSNETAGAMPANFCNVLEVGVYYGASMCAFTSSNAESVRYVGVDSWEQYGDGGGRVEAAHNADYCTTYGNGTLAAAAGAATNPLPDVSSNSHGGTKMSTESIESPLIALLHGDCWVIGDWLVNQHQEAVLKEECLRGGGSRCGDEDDSSDSSSNNNSRSSRKGLNGMDQHHPMIALHTVAAATSKPAPSVDMETIDSWIQIDDHYHPHDKNNGYSEATAISSSPVDIFHFDGA